MKRWLDRWPLKLLALGLALVVWLLIHLKKSSVLIP